MHRYFDIELFGWQKVSSKWWNLTILRVASGSWQCYLFMIESNLDETSIEWFTFKKTKHGQE